MTGHILVTTDFSKRAEAAYPFAAAAAEALKLPIVVLHVISASGHDPLLKFVPNTEWGRQLRSRTRARLRDVCRHLIRQGLRAELQLEGGVVHEVVTAALERAELAVMAPHGFGVIGRLLFGSVAPKVVRKTACPVLLVNARCAPGPFRRALLPTATDLAARALPDAVGWARRLGAESVELLHAVVVPDQAIFARGEISVARAMAVSDGMLDTSRAALNAMLVGIPTGLKPTATVVRARRAASAIVEHARGSADIIIMPAHRYGAMQRLLVGSVTEEVIRSCDRPVLVLRQDSDKTPAAESLLQ